MRIISGKYGRRKLKTPNNLLLRPTTDQAKEGLFNIISNRCYFDEIDVLDLFAGTGAISYEFISRGVPMVTAVENNLIHFKYITSVKKELQMDNLYTIKGDVFKYLEHNTQVYDLIFADPPYNLEKLADLPDLVFNGKHLKDDGEFILEHPVSHDFSKHKYFIETRRYGKVHFSFFKIK